MWMPADNWVCVTARPPGFEGIRLLISVESEAPQSVLEDVLAASLRYSPLIDALQNPQTIETSLVVRETV